MKLVKRMLCFILVGLISLQQFSAMAEDSSEKDYIFDSTTGTITKFIESGFVGNVIIPNTIGGIPVKVIKKNAFDGCYWITGIVIPEGVTEIGDKAFSNCTSLSKIDFSSSVSNIGENALQGCENLSEINVDEKNSNFSTENGILYNKDKSILIKYPLKDQYSFSIPQTVISINNFAFEYSNKLYSLNIPKSVVNIDVNSFYADTFTEFKVSEENKYYSSSEGILYNKNKSILIKYPASKLQNTLTIPASVVRIYKNAFCDSRYLENVILNDGLTKIDEGSFVVSSISQISIPSSVENIEPFTFMSCHDLNSVSIAEGVLRIEDGAFDGCINLKSISIPSSIENIGQWAFYYCRSLSSCIFNGNAPTMGDNVFGFNSSDFTIRYNSSAIGFTTPNWLGYNAVPLSIITPTNTTTATPTSNVTSLPTVTPVAATSASTKEPVATNTVTPNAISPTITATPTSIITGVPTVTPIVATNTSTNAPVETQTPTTTVTPTSSNNGGGSPIASQTVSATSTATSMKTTHTPATTVTPTATNSSNNGGGNSNSAILNTATATNTSSTPSTTITPTTTLTANNEVSPAPTEPEKKIPAAITLKDIQNHWAKEQIQELVNKGIISGYSDLTFKPDNGITRAELTVIIIKALGLTAQTGNTNFKDDKDIPNWAKGYIKTAIENGIISGYSDSTFRASKQCTRQETVAMVMKAFKLGNSNAKLNFKDASIIQAWASGFISKAIELEIIKGYDDKTFKPNNNVTRAEASAIIIKALNKQLN